MKSPDTGQTRRCNEPEWEPKAIKWFRPGATPEPGLYWFDGFVDLSMGACEPVEGRYAVLITEDGWVNGFDAEEFSAFRSKVGRFFGEWYGPFEHPPWFGETMVEPAVEMEEGEAGDGI